MNEEVKTEHHEHKETGLGHQHHESSSHHKTKLRVGVWKLLTLVFLVLFIAAILTKGFSFSSGVSEKEAVNKALTFINTQLLQGQASAELEAVKEEGGVYALNLSVNGQKGKTYVNKEGSLLFLQGIEMKEALAQSQQAADQTTPTQVTKSDKPKVEAFVFSYCPYGLQIEKALAPVYDLLKSQTDINIVFIGAMHGEYEKQESLRQLCIQKYYGKDKLWAYLNKFIVDKAVGACSNNMDCSKPLVEAIMTSLGVDKSKINACMPTEGASLYDSDVAKAKGLGIGGSPTLVVNGVEVDIGSTSKRNPEYIKKTVCGAFTTALAECSQNLSTSAMSAGFGASVSSGTASAASCG